MRSQRSRRNPSTAGFSMIEILIVLAVIGIIASISVSTLMAARDKAKQGATIADMRNLATAIEAYTVDYSVSPSTAPFDSVAMLLQPYHNARVPATDHWGHVYSYVRTTTNDYSLTSFGKDGIDGDEITPETRLEFDRDIVIENGKFNGLR